MTHKQQLIELAIDVIQTYGYYNEKKQAYHDGGYSTQEYCFEILHDQKIIKDIEWVKKKELEDYAMKRESGFMTREEILELITGYFGMVPNANWKSEDRRKLADQLLQLHIQGEKQLLDKIIKLIDEGNDAESIIRFQAESGIYRGVEGLPLQGEQPKE